ncbi:MAG: zinc-binding dehydrogenase [Faecousia sp.]
MISYILQEPGKIVPTEEAKPTPQGHEVLIRVRNVGICGSDIHLFRGSYNGPHSYPMKFGHEWSGTVEAIGSDVTKVKPGDLVTGDCSKYCGKCPSCQHDKNLCGHIEKFGITVDGASAEYILRDEMYLYKSPEGMDQRLLALTEPVAVAAHLISKIKRVLPQPFSELRVLVLGGGVIGMSALMLLRHMEGCQQAELYDLAESRKAVAASEGARIPAADELQCGTDAGDYASMYAAAKYDVVLETTGVAPVFANALNLVRPGGVLGCVGMIAKVEIPQKLIVTKSLTVIGSIGGTGDFERAMEFLVKHPRSAEKLISHVFSAAQAEEAFATARNPEGSMKVVLSL